MAPLHRHLLHQLCLPLHRWLLLLFPLKKPAAYDWDFYLEPSRLSVVKNERNAELKKLYYQVYGTPCGGWYDGVSPSAAKNEGWLKNFVEGAERAQKTPIVVLYGIPNRDCGSFSKGGHPTAASYKAWIDRVSAIIGQRRAVVIVEPDAINYCGHKKVPKPITNELNCSPM